MFWICEAKNGTKIDELLQDGASEHKKAWQDVKTISDSRRRRRAKRRTTRKEYKKLRNKLEMESFMAQKSLWNLARNKKVQDMSALPKEESDVIREYKVMHEENFLSNRLREDGKDKTKDKKKEKWR